MKKMKLAVAVTSLASALAAMPALAGDKNPAIFPTDVLDQFSGAVAATYTFTSTKTDATYVNGAVTDVNSGKFTSNMMQWRADIGLGYGLQIGAYQNIELGARDEFSWNGATPTINKTSGGYNPLYQIKWNPLQIVDAKSPVQILLAYRVKPKGVASKSVSDDYTQNTGTAIVSYKMSDLGLRTYLGYEYSQLGKEGTSGNSFDMGRENSILVGAEYQLMKGFDLTLDYTATIAGGAPIRTESYATNTVALGAQYKIPGLDKVNLYVSPFFKASIVGEQTLDAAQVGADSAKIDSYVAYSGGLTLKAVF